MKPNDKAFDFRGVSQIEFSKRLKALRDVVSQDEYEDHLVPLIPSDQRVAVERSMSGLTQEDEFAVMSRLMGTAKFLIPLEQAPILGGKPRVPDFLGIFETTLFDDSVRDTLISTYKCFIEVKSTKQASYRSGGAALERLRDVSLGFAIPLIFAVRFVQYPTHPVWAFVEDQGGDKPLEVITSDFLSGIKKFLWNDTSYWIEESVSIEMQYSYSFDDRGVSSEKYGHLGRLVLELGSQQWILEDENVGLVAMCLKAFNLESDTSETCFDGTIYYQRSRPKRRFVTMVDLVCQINNLAVDDKGVSIYNPPLLIAKSDKLQEDDLISRTEIEQILNSLIDIAVIIPMTYDELIDMLGVVANSGRD